MSDYWKDNGIEKPQQVIVCAACRRGKLILAGARHWDNVMREQRVSLMPHMDAATSQWEQGFIDQFGDFLTREEALNIATDARQPINMIRNGSDSELFSEGLY